MSDRSPRLRGAGRGIWAARRRLGVTAAAAATACLVATQLPADASHTSSPPLAPAPNAAGGGGTGPGATNPGGPASTTTTTAPPTTTTTTTAPPTTTTTTAPTATTTTLPPHRTAPTTPTTAVNGPSKGAGTTSSTTTVPTTTNKSLVAPNSSPTTTAPPQAPSQQSNGGCQPDPAAAIAALPPGGVFHGSGCYTTLGILITKPVTIDGGVYNDPQTESSGKHTVFPIIRVKNTNNVTVENVVLNGSDLTGGYHRDMVNAAGFDILSSDHVTLINDTTDNTFGDGVTLFADFSIDGNPVTNLYVNGLTVTNAGRQGITMGYVKGAELDNVTVNSAAESGWDFESDLPHVGSGNVVINNADNHVGVHLIEALQGPITFNNCQCWKHVHDINDAAESGQLVTFNGGSYQLARDSSTGINVAGIVIAGPGRMVMNNVDISRLPGPFDPKGPSISVTGGGHLTLVDSPLPKPAGTHDAQSTVTIVRK